jgi:hypothetical protein
MPDAAIPDNRAIVQHITRLVDHEHELRQALQSGTGIDDEGRSKLKAIEVELDQCWDLLRQRRAKLEFSADPEDATVRDAGTVEHYQQ